MCGRHTHYFCTKTTEPNELKYYFKGRIIILHREVSEGWLCLLSSVMLHLHVVYVLQTMKSHKGKALALTYTNIHKCSLVHIYGPKYLV